jgi:hypothetical protein
MKVGVLFSLATFFGINFCFAEKVITPRPDQGNLALEAPAGFPRDIDAVLYVQTAYPPISILFADVKRRNYSATG